MNRQQLTLAYETMNIEAQRLPSGELRTNVPRLVTRHSPTGFEIGYPGSGPADFALNILLCFERRFGLDADKLGGAPSGPGAFTNRWYQEFKRDFIQGMDRAGGLISGQAIAAWIYDRAEDGDALDPRALSEFAGPRAVLEVGT